MTLWYRYENVYVATIEEDHAMFIYKTTNLKMKNSTGFYCSKWRMFKDKYVDIFRLKEYILNPYFIQKIHRM